MICQHFCLDFMLSGLIKKHESGAFAFTVRPFICCCIHHNLPCIQDILEVILAGALIFGRLIAPPVGSTSHD